MKRGKKRKNIIVGEIYISDYFLNKKIRIINSFGKTRPNHYNIPNHELSDYENEKEILKNTKIKINGKNIDFSYYCSFKKKGLYTIEYSFRDSLRNVDYMFSDCNLLTSLDLSNFNNDDVENMSGMFN